MIRRSHPDAHLLAWLPASRAQPLPRHLELLLGPGVEEKAARRYLRLMVRDPGPYTRAMVAYVAAYIASLPVQLLPVPNVPGYLLGYRVFTYWRSARQARMLGGALRAGATLSAREALPVGAKGRSAANGLAELERLYPELQLGELVRASDQYFSRGRRG